jgi:hypothetical protein
LRAVVPANAAVAAKRGTTENFFWTGDKSKAADFDEIVQGERNFESPVPGVIGSSMLVIVGMILLLTWIFDHAVHLTPSSLVNLLLLFASISFVLDFVRERENMRHPRPGWDAMPPRGWVRASIRRFRHKAAYGTGPDRPTSPQMKATRAA